MVRDEIKEAGSRDTNEGDDILRRFDSNARRTSEIQYKSNKIKEVSRKKTWQLTILR